MDGARIQILTASLTVSVFKQARQHSGGHLVDKAMENVGQRLLAGKGYHFEKGAYVEYIGAPPAPERPALLAALQPCLLQNDPTPWPIKSIGELHGLLTTFKVVMS